MNDKIYVGWFESQKEDFDLFVVFRVNKDWYWQFMTYDKSPMGMTNGPFPTAEGAYLSATGD